MAKFIGKSKLNAAVFISGRGSNLKSLINFTKKKLSPIKIVLVVSNNKEAQGLNYAKINNIKNIVVIYKNKLKAEKKLLGALLKYKIRLICLAGFMKILSKKFILKFEGKILNIHPSLLPNYKGLNTHRRVIENKEKFTGCTVHLVNSRLDSGKIILQKKIKILRKDNENSLAKKVLKLEHQLYPRAIVKFLSSR
ncbi:MAG TPA: phosphoribosylglycinamide formyltransferase [Candidatus Pelagibacter sp.]|jgi:formyltetrahydrofolate-dependent phosphoribosylglycinamide formyltransferase|nr:phosphoribosylglycinamide formyltransferase [Candidatus Pelagibacter sp.]